MKCIYHMHRQVELQHAAAVAPDKATKYKKREALLSLIFFYTLFPEGLLFECQEMVHQLFK